MPRKTDVERIDDLAKAVTEIEKLIARIVKEIEILGKSLDRLHDSTRESGEGHHELRRNYERELAVLKRDLEELRRWADRNGSTELRGEAGVLKEKVVQLEAARERDTSRAWSLVPNVVGAVVSSGLAALVAYFVARR